MIPSPVLYSFKEKVFLLIAASLFFALIMVTAYAVWQKFQLDLCESEKSELSKKLDLQNLGLDLIKEKDQTIEEIKKQLEQVIKEKRRRFDDKAGAIKLIPISGKECEDMKLIIRTARENETD